MPVSNGSVALNLQGAGITTDDLKQRLKATFPSATPRPNISSSSDVVPPQAIEPPISSAPAPPSLPTTTTTRDSHLSASTTQNTSSSTVTESRSSPGRALDSIQAPAPPSQI